MPGFPPPMEPLTPCNSRSSPPTLPIVVASSVIRSAHQGDSHGGVYLVNLETEQVRQVIDWDDAAIDWSGRGKDRGLRGIAFHSELVYVAASDEIFVYDRHFDKRGSFTNPYLRHCHEIFVHEGMLYLTSTGFDAVLACDLDTHRFVEGWCVRYPGVSAVLRCLGEERGKQWGRGIARLRSGSPPTLRTFDPNGPHGPPPGDTMHINNVYVADGVIYLAGTNMRHLFAIHDGRIRAHAPLPFKTHNARPFRGGVLFNDTAANHVRWRMNGQTDSNDVADRSFAVREYPADALLHNDLPQDHARQGFGRGLCLVGDELVAGGSSPATISVYDLATGRTVKTINLTMDVRNSIHGLNVWPFDD